MITTIFIIYDFFFLKIKKPVSESSKIYKIDLYSVWEYDLSSAFTFIPIYYFNPFCPPKHYSQQVSLLVNINQLTLLHKT